MKARLLGIAIVLGVAACGGNAAGPGVVPAGAESLSAAQVDSLWQGVNDAYRRRKWDDAIARIERFLLEAPATDPRRVEARMMSGESQFGKKNRIDAAREFRKVSDETPTHPLAPVALLRVGDAYAELWRRPELDPTYGLSALATYQELLSRYPDSDAAKQGQVKIAAINDQLAAKAFKSARYYLRLRAYDSAIIYLRDLLATYPRSSVAPQALVALIGAYQRLGYLEDVRETCTYLRRFHPDATDADRACPAGLAPADTVTPVPRDSVPPSPQG